MTGRPFIPYTSALDHSLGGILAQNDDDGIEVALYYHSRILVGAEHNYLPVEKECLALMFTVEKLYHYVLSNTVYLVSRVNLLKVLVTKAGSLSDRLAKWSIGLSQYDIRYMLAKAVKGQALANFLAKHPLSEDSPLNDKLPHEPSYLMDWASRIVVV